MQLQVKVALRLSLAVNVVVCSLGIFRVCLLHMSAAEADSDRDVIADATNQRRAQASPNGTASEYLVPNIVHYIWSARYFHRRTQGEGGIYTPKLPCIARQRVRTASATNLVKFIPPKRNPG